MNTTTEQIGIDADQIRAASRDTFQNALADLKADIAKFQEDLDAWSERVDKFARTGHV